MSIEDFKMIRLLGKGGFGSVFLATKRSNNQEVAIKVIKKESVFKKNCLQQIWNEKNILGLQNPKFLVNVFYTFQDEKNLYFVMKYMQNGSLKRLLEK